MEWSDDAIVLSLRAHGESSGILEALTRDHGRPATQEAMADGEFECCVAVRIITTVTTAALPCASWLPRTAGARAAVFVLLLLRGLDSLHFGHRAFASELLLAT